MTTSETDCRRLWYPPGGLMVWLFILVELLTFGAALCVFAYQMSLEPAIYREAQAMLNLPLAVANTVILITSGFFVARGVASHQAGNDRGAARWTLAGAGAGTVFLVLKGLEYAEKHAAGIDLGTNTFFAYYWALTGFHGLHVLLGVVILLLMARKFRLGTPFVDADVSAETGAAYWHMCDLLWVMIFTVVYLFR